MNKEIITKTEQSLARIFALCDKAADSGQTIRTEKEGRDAARSFLGLVPVVTKYPFGPALEPLTVHPGFTNKLDAFLRKGV